jgi:hypothetical protein
LRASLDEGFAAMRAAAHDPGQQCGHCLEAIGASTARNQYRVLLCSSCAGPSSAAVETPDAGGMVIRDHAPPDALLTAMSRYLSEPEPDHVPGRIRRTV